jgi:Mce-associated membrane protein
MAALADTPSRRLSKPADAEADADAENDVDTDGDEVVEVREEADQQADAGVGQRFSSARLAVAFGLIVVLTLAGLVGWLGFRTFQSHRAEQQRALFLQVGRQGALNLTTIDYQHAETDVRRILDSAAGTFRDDFSKRSQPFIDVVKQAQSKSVGTVTEAGLESESGDQAQVLVAVMVKTSNAGAAEQDPRLWRMRISVQKVGDQAKVSNVEFVP